MKWLTFRIIASLSAAFFLFSSYTVPPYDGDKASMVAKVLMMGMQSYHYQPQKFNDDFSATVFEDFIGQIDYSKRFFTAKDVQQLQKYRQHIDDELREGSLGFCEESAQLFGARMDQARGYMEAILAQPFDFTKEEYYDDDVEKMAWAADEREIRERWRLSLKYATLARLHDLMKRQENPDFKGEKKSQQALEAEARAKVLKNQQDFFLRLSREREKGFADTYLNTIAASSDPHTGYFPPDDKASFDISMSGRLEGIGAQLSEDEGYIKVVSIVPGSASSRQGQLQVNDLILKVGQGKEEPVDVVGMAVDDAVKLIRGPKGSEVRLTVRKLDGAEVTIPIVRDIVELEETFAKSALLREEGSDLSVGYIYLPKFYADFQHRNGRRCATDVRAEIRKLKAENVGGIILDLRDNSGGSLQDVVEMAGYFIDKGPIVQVKSRNEEPEVLSDPYAGVEYDGKLVIMVNSFSASASEIMAAAIQDYGRGVIIGSESTFGKGTVQRFYNLDDLVRVSPEVRPLGEVKMTTQKFYRINGGATQLRGVESDIVLPDNYSLLELGEKEEKHSMAWDEIAPAAYSAWPGALSTQLPALRAASRQRLSASPAFARIQENAERFKERQDRNRYSLRLSDYSAEQKNIEEEAKKYRDLLQPIEPFQIGHLAADQASILADSVRSKRYATWHEGLKKDVYVYEALQVMKDLP
jgi:carboxyl-terminal processing protease